MEINFKKGEVCDFIQNYYKEVENTDAKVKITAKREPIGLYETMGCVTRVEVTKKVTILGIEKEVKDYLTQDEVLGIFNELLKDRGYEVTSLSYDAGTQQQTVGYYMNEHTEYRAYFNGITLYVKQKENNNNKNLNRKLG